MGTTHCKASLCKCNHNRKPSQNAKEFKKAIQYHLNQWDFQEEKKQTEARVKKFIEEFEDHIGGPRTPDPKIEYYWQT